MGKTMHHRHALLLALLASTGCSAGADDSGEPDGPGSTQGGNPGGGTAGSGAQGDLFTVEGSSGSGSGASTVADLDKCEAVEQAAETIAGEADVIWILDNSGSMLEEANAVQAGMNQFANFVTSSGIDIHVVLLSETAPPSALNPLATIGICVPAPFGSGNCPDDTNLSTGFLHFFAGIDSWMGLQIFQDTYPNWEAHLRPRSSKMIIMVTDDNSLVASAAFKGFVDAQPKFQSSATPWRFSALYCPVAGPNCSQVGTVYTELIQATGGISGSVADGTGFQTIIDEIAKVVVAESKPVDCEWVIPPPPEGESFDPTKVNVKYTTGAGEIVDLYNVPDAGGCDPVAGGWHYDNPAAPGRVVACGSSCSAMQGDQGASVEVVFGCATKLFPQ